jgi:hypothetical protein
MAKRKHKPIQLEELPPEQMERGEFEKQFERGMEKARIVRTPVIKTLHARGRITKAEYQALAFYRDQATLAERGLYKSCLDISPKGNGSGPSPITVSAAAETKRMEALLQSLLPFVRAVAVDDVTLSAWLDSKGKAKLVCRNKGGIRRCTPEPSPAVMELALNDLRMAARRLAQYRK